MSSLFLSIDPGLATGICCMEWSPGFEPTLLWSDEIDMDHFAPQVRSILAKYPDINVVCERFVINAQTAKKTQAPYSLELIGVLRQCLRDIGRAGDDFTFQSPTDAKNLFPNPALKKLGYWHKGGAGHALDAIRHALLAITNKGWPPARLLD